MWRRHPPKVSGTKSVRHQKCLTPLVAAVVAAAGAGTRIGAREGKLWLPLAGSPLLAHSLRALERCPEIRWIQVVARDGEAARVERLARAAGITKLLPPCAGGPSRAESVARGIGALPAEAAWVVVHDAARPCVRPALVSAVVREALRHDAVACGVPANLTVKAADAQRRVRLTLDREQLWFIQTPQAFRRAWFAEALARARAANGAGTLAQFPDDVSLLEWAGFPVTLVPGDSLNLKVTTREDLRLAAALLRRNGHDVTHANRHRVRYSSV